MKALDAPAAAIPTMKAPDLEGAVERGAEKGAERGTEKGARRAAADRAERRDEERMRGIRESAAKAAQRRLDLLGDVPGTRQGMRRAALRHVRQGHRPAQEQGGLTEADVRRMHFEFLGSLQGITNQFGSNIRLDEGQLGTHAYAQTQLQRELVQGVQQLSRSMWHPGASYAGAQLSAAGIGSGF